MNLVIAVKAEPKRQARVTQPQYVTLLLTTSEEAADAQILHRDGEYNSKLQGTCFTCSKLNANPPQSVCDVPDPDGPPSGCILLDEDPCTCNDCPPPPPPRECACSTTTGYPAPNTEGLGSGYWVGLQANTYYSIVPNGGWVVAVSCTSSEILGAFPVTGSNFGYGRGDIGGNPVMIYPAGSVRGAGYVPANETSFPILALTTSDGNAIIADGFTDGIVSGSSLPRCPSLNPTKFCTASNSFLYEGFPKPCLGKFPRTQSDCPDYDNFKEWPENKPYNDEQNAYYISMANVSGFTGQVTGSISFTSSSGQSYCGTIEDWVQKPNDALSGACGGTEWVDPPTSFYDNCVQCTDENVKVPCKYLLNTTNGDFNQFNGGYGNGFFGIGPALPPNTSDSGSTASGGSGRYWNTFWNWEQPTDPNGGDPGYFYTDSTGASHLAFIPPIGNLLDKCKCPDDTARNSSIVWIESFECCDPVAQTAGLAAGLTAYKPFTPGYSGCGVGCKSACPHLKCSCYGTSGEGGEGAENNLGRPSIYGYIPCHLCEDIPLNTGEPISGVWWTVSTSVGLAAIPARNEIIEGSATPPGPNSSCKNIFGSLGSPTCQCGSLYDLDNTDPSNPFYTLNFDKLELCTGFRDPDEFLQDPCMRSEYLPANLKDCSLTYSTDPVSTMRPPFQNWTYDNVFANHIIVNGNCGQCTDGQSLMECLCPDPSDASCFLRNIGGPFALPYETDSTPCGDPFPALMVDCSVPRKETDEYPNCNGDMVNDSRLKFKPINRSKCSKPEGMTEETFNQLTTDPCGCCDRSIDQNGGGAGIPSVGCASSNPSGPCQADCCQGSGCATGDCELDPSIIVGNGQC